MSAKNILCMFGAMAALIAAPGVAKGPSDEAPATQLRVALDRVLAEHAFLLIQAMRTGLTPGPEFDAAAGALDANTNQLVAAIQSVYGKDAADAFGEQWRSHIGFIVDYARALNVKDSSAATLADSQLQQYVTNFSTLLASVVALPEAAVEGLIREHVEQLEQVASFETARYGEAYPAIRQTYEHMFMIGDGLATAIVAQSPARFTGRDFAFSPATNLRLQIDRLFGEHVELAGLALRARLNDAPDVTASTAALDDNAAALTEAIGSIYGAAAGAAFRAQWLNHNQLFLDYVAALKSKDSAAQAAALEGLRQYKTAFTSFLVEANPLISEPTFGDLIAAHNDRLVAEADQYAKVDFAAAYTTGREAFAQSGELSAYLASAIAGQFPSRFPSTAMSPIVASPERANLQLMGLAFVVVGALLFVMLWIRLLRQTNTVAPVPGRQPEGPSRRK